MRPGVVMKIEATQRGDGGDRAEACKDGLVALISRNFNDRVVLENGILGWLQYFTILQVQKDPGARSTDNIICKGESDKGFVGIPKGGIPMIRYPVS